MWMMGLQGQVILEFVDTPCELSRGGSRARPKMSWYNIDHPRPRPGRPAPQGARDTMPGINIFKYKQEFLNQSLNSKRPVFCYNSAPFIFPEIILDY